MWATPTQLGAGLSVSSIVVAASGNDGCNCIGYPANYPEVVAVGAVNSTGNPTSFSNYGANLDILAPGQSMTTSTWSAGNQTSAYASSVAGTSFATPFVSGILAIGKSYQPTANWEEILGAMFENSDRRTLTNTSPKSDLLGYGVAKAGTMIARTRTQSNEIIRYQFGGGTMLGSNRSYQCSSSQIPANPIYELKKLGQINYTSNLRTLSAYAQTGWTSRLLANTCMGLPGDIIGSLRMIDLPNETLNLQTKQ